MGIYQLRYLERIPPHAAVADSVELVKRARKRSAAGFVNAVLRKVDRDGRRVAQPRGGTLLPGVDAGSLGTPLRRRGRRRYRPRRAPGAGKVHARRAASRTSAPQSIVPLLGLAPGQRFLDLCAAPGNKTAQALESGVRAVACDLHYRRLAPMQEPHPNLVVLDATQPLPFAHPFDRILLDAPCSGTGTLGRNPEIKWRLAPADLDDLHRRQAALLANARAALAPGGLLVYSTCSLEPEENEAVVAAVPPELLSRPCAAFPAATPGMASMPL